MTRVHTEEAFEALIEDQLVRNGYSRAHLSTYDRDRTLLVDELIGFVQDTQPKKWSVAVGKFQESNPNVTFLDWLRTSPSEGCSARAPRSMALRLNSPSSDLHID